MSKVKSNIPNVLAFERKIDPSDAVFSCCNWDERDGASQPLGITEKSVRGTISNRLSAKEGSDPAKLDAQIQNPNLQTVDVCSLPQSADTLRVDFTLRITGDVGKPNACDKPEYAVVLKAKIDEYIADHGFDALAVRYANNIANGRFLWRNLTHAGQVEVHVEHVVAGASAGYWVFDALSYSRDKFASDDSVKSVAAVIANSLKNGYALLRVTAFARVGPGQEVYPSQELILDSSNGKKGKKGKTLYSVGGVAAMHSQKIGNAVRVIDDWYPGDSIGPIPVEPYGSVTSLGKAFRRPTDKADFYTLLDGWIAGKATEVEQQHFIIANFVRGGVFGG